MIKNILLIGFAFFSLFNKAQNFSITYGFPEVITSSGQIDPSNTPTLVGINFGSFTANGTSPNPNASGRFSYTNWPLGAIHGDDNYGNYTGVLSPTVYYEITLSVNPGYTLNLNTLSFDVRRSGTGIRTFCLRSSLDNFTNNLSANTGTSTNLSVIPSDIFFWNSDATSTSNDQRGSRIGFNSNYSALTGSLSIRFYAWNSESNGGSFSIDNVNFVGELVDSISLTSLQKQVSNNTSLSSLSIYPNPCQSSKLSIKSSSRFSTLHFIDMTGKIYHSEKYPKATEQSEVAISEFQPGLYLLKIVFENHMEQRYVYISSNKTE